MPSLHTSTASTISSLSTPSPPPWTSLITLQPLGLAATLTLHPTPPPFTPPSHPLHLHLTLPHPSLLTSLTLTTTSTHSTPLHSASIHAHPHAHPSPSLSPPLLAVNGALAPPPSPPTITESRTFPLHRSCRALTISLAAHPSAIHAAFTKGDPVIITARPAGFHRLHPAPRRALRVALKAPAAVAAAAADDRDDRAAPHRRRDAAEADGVLALALLAAGRKRQAAELLQEAAAKVREAAAATAESGGEAEREPQLAAVVRGELRWADELDLLAAHAWFEVEDAAHGGVAALLRVAQSCAAAPADADADADADARAERRGGAGAERRRRQRRRWRRDGEFGRMYLDARTEVLAVAGPLLRALTVHARSASSVAVRLAALRMVRYVVAEVGYVAAPFLGEVVAFVLREYPRAGAVGAGKGDRAALALFECDTFEDAFVEVLDVVCGILPAARHSVLRGVLEECVFPAVRWLMRAEEELEGRDRRRRREECPELLETAKAQAMRIATLILRVVEGDAKVPAAFVGDVLEILMGESERGDLLLRRAALHCWDALLDAVGRGRGSGNVPELVQLVRLETEALGRLVTLVERPEFVYKSDKTGGEESTGEGGVWNVALGQVDSDVLRNVAARRARTRSVVGNWFTLRRLLALIERTCAVLQPADFAPESAETASNEPRSDACAALWALQRELADTAADVLMTSLIDVSYAEACASGLGLDAVNNHMEFPELEAQMRVSCEVVEGLLSCLWAALALLPREMAAEAERSSPLLHVLAWCADRMSLASPPPAMLYLLTSTVSAMRHELNVSMQATVDGSSGIANGCVTFHELFRVLLRWLPQAASDHAFDLIDELVSGAAGDLTASDVFGMVEALCDQPEAFEERAGSSMDHFAALVVSQEPKQEQQARDSLKTLARERSADERRVQQMFRKTSERTLSFVRSIHLGTVDAPPAESTPSRSGSLMQSFYLHVVLASCLDMLDDVDEDEWQNRGPQHSGRALTRFANHAAFAIQVLTKAGADGSTRHREYISNILGGSFVEDACAMYAHYDGRVRVAGLRLFAAAVDLLFVDRGLKEATGVVLPSFFSEKSKSGEEVIDLDDETRDDTGTLYSSLGPEGATVCSESDGDELDSSFLTATHDTHSSIYASVDQSDSRDHTHGVRKSTPSFASAAAHVFASDSASRLRLKAEDIGWRALSKFLSQVFGVGRDYALQREALEFLLERILNAMLGLSSGAAVLSMKLVIELWDSSTRLAESPGRAPHALAFWGMCALLNTGLFLTVTGKSRRKARLFGIFASRCVLPAIERALDCDAKDTRLWGGRLLETYLRGREMNLDVLKDIPLPNVEVLKAAELQISDWSREQRNLAQSLGRLCWRARQSDGSESGDLGTTGPVPRALSARLWFPAVPQATAVESAALFDFTLEAFANSKIAGGEEVEDIWDVDQEAVSDDENSLEMEDVQENGSEEEGDGSGAGVASAFEEEVDAQDSSLPATSMLDVGDSATEDQMSEATAEQRPRDSCSSPSLGSTADCEEEGVDDESEQASGEGRGVWNFGAADQSLPATVLNAGDSAKTTEPDEREDKSTPPKLELNLDGIGFPMAPGLARPEAAEGSSTGPGRFAGPRSPSVFGENAALDPSAAVGSGAPGKPALPVMPTLSLPPASLRASADTPVPPASPTIPPPRTTFGSSWGRVERPPKEVSAARPPHPPPSPPPPSPPPLPPLLPSSSSDRTASGGLGGSEVDGNSRVSPPKSQKSVICFRGGGGRGDSCSSYSSDEKALAPAGTGSNSGSQGQNRAVVEPRMEISPRTIYLSSGEGKVPTIGRLSGEWPPRRAGGRSTLFNPSSPGVSPPAISPIWTSGGQRASNRISPLPSFDKSDSDSDDDTTEDDSSDVKSTQSAPSTPPPPLPPLPVSRSLPVPQSPPLNWCGSSSGLAPLPTLRIATSLTSSALTDSAERPSVQQSSRWRPGPPRFSNRHGIGVRQVASAAAGIGMGRGGDDGDGEDGDGDEDDRRLRRRRLASGETGPARTRRGTPAVHVGAGSAAAAAVGGAAKGWARRRQEREGVGEEELDSEYAETLSAFDPSLVVPDERCEGGVR